MASIASLGQTYHFKAKSDTEVDGKAYSYSKVKQGKQLGNVSKKYFPKPQENVNKRRYSYTCSNEYKHPFKRRRRHETMILPTKFLLGGNINDPLNLESLADEEVNKKMNEVTPYSSPVPTPKYHGQIEVLIPPNINDPLNLNTNEELKLFSPNAKKRRRNRHKRKESKSASEKTESTERENAVMQVPEEVRSLPEKVVDKIVSPVVPQGSPTKFARRNRLSRTLQRDDDKGKRHGGPRQGTKPTKSLHFRKKDECFQYGNYNRYYGYRNRCTDDTRLQCMKKEWFKSKDILDIGCNVGHLTLSIARDMKPRKIIGLDIDEKLIKVARKNVRHYLTTDLTKGMQFPISMAICHGPIAAAALPGREVEETVFPNNVFFVKGNYVLESDELLETQKPEFDTILCLSLTKWIHLNWGDEGLKRVFRRMYAQLRPGGHVILEAQPWPSYGRKKKLTETTYNNYMSIKFKPENFTEYLLSKEVGFSTCELLDTPAHPSKGFCRPMHLFTKSDVSREMCENDV